MFGLPGPSGGNGLIGAGTLRNTAIQSGVEHNVAFYNLSGSMTLAIQNTTGLPGGCHIGFNSATTGQGGLAMQLQGTAVGSVECAAVPVPRQPIGRRCWRRRAAAANLTLAVNGADIAFTGQGIDGVVLSNADDASVTATITGSSFYNLSGQRCPARRRPQPGGVGEFTCFTRRSPETRSRAGPSAGPGIAAALSSTLWAGGDRPTPVRPRTACSRYTPAARESSITTPNAGTSPVAAHDNREQSRGYEGSARVCQRARADRRASVVVVDPSRPPTSAPTSWGTPRTGRPGHQRGPGGGILAEQAAARRSGWSEGPKRC